jgi:hypothetical protein
MWFKNHLKGEEGPSMFWKSVAFIGTLALLSSGAKIASPVTAQAFQKAEALASVRHEALDETKYVDLLAEDSSFSYNITSRSHTDYYQSFTFQFKDIGSENYILGNYEAGEEYFPLTFYYDIKKADGTTEQRSSIATLKNVNYSYDAIGESFAAQTTYYNYADLQMNKGESIDPLTLKIVNVFHVTEQKNVATDGTVTYSYVPDYTKNYILKNPTVTSAGKINYALDEFLPTIALKKVNFFGGYSSVICSYTSAAKAQYEKYMSSTYENNAETIASGREQIRSRFSSLTNSSIRVNYADGSNYVEKIRGTDFLRIGDKGDFQFLLKGINGNNVSSIELLDATLYCDIWDNDKSVIISRSAITWRFGVVTFMAATAKAPYLNYNVLMILVTLAAMLAVAGAATGAYFYQKNKYKNDEFNRITTKGFLKKAAVAFFYSMLWVEEILVLIGRAVALNNSLTVFNPFDVLIIVFSVALIIYTGYYIKFFIGYFKDRKMKKMEDTLKLNESVADDGTVITKK